MSSEGARASRRAVVKRRTINEILAAKAERERIAQETHANTVESVVADHDLLWEAVRTTAVDVSDVKAGLEGIAGDIKFIARVFKVVTVTAPTLAAMAAILSYLKVI